MSNDDLYGLILMGGQSSRMEMDKSTLEYHGKSQLDHLYDLLQARLPQVFVSVRKGQSVQHENQKIEDSLEVSGPINGIVSAMRKYPDKSWLVLAIDLPFLNKHTIDQLIENRNPSALGTSMATQKSKLPEPLIAIWESQALRVLEKFHYDYGMLSPRKFMIDHKFHLIHPNDDRELYNANHPDEYRFAKSIIRKMQDDTMGNAG
ncbi:MAG: hypothetical protein Tsb0034_16360 [Ekhidna sp.]